MISGEDCFLVQIWTVGIGIVMGIAIGAAMGYTWGRLKRWWADFTRKGR